MARALYLPTENPLHVVQWLLLSLSVLKEKHTSRGQGLFLATLYVRADKFDLLLTSLLVLLVQHLHGGLLNRVVVLMVAARGILETAHIEFLLFVRFVGLRPCGLLLLTG